MLVLLLLPFYERQMRRYVRRPDVGCPQPLPMTTMTPEMALGSAVSTCGPWPYVRFAPWPR